MSCKKWGSPKVCWKFIDPPGYDDGLMIKSSVSVFLVHLPQEKRVATCALWLYRIIFNSEVSVASNVSLILLNHLILPKTVTFRFKILQILL